MLFRSYNTNAQTPDSAGTAVAMNTGIKTKSGVIGVDETLRRGECDDVEGASIEAFGETMSDMGKSVGVVTTARWKPRTAVLAEDETLLCFSDGLLEVFGSSEHDAIRQIEVLLRTHPRTADLIDTIRHLAQSTEALDDVTAVALRRLGSNER